MGEKLDSNCIGYMIRVTMFNGPVMVKLLAIEPDRIFVVGETGERFWLSLSEIKIG